MRYALKTIAAEQFAHVQPRKQREHAAENALVSRFFDDVDAGVFVEVGANDPFYYSQTWHLEQRGWRGLLIEPIAALCDKLRRDRPGSTVVRCACAGPGQHGQADLHIATADGQSTLQRDAAHITMPFDRTERVPLRPLDDVLDEANLPRLDFVSIDVEGAQLDVLRGFDIARHRPALLLIEDHLLDLATHRHMRSAGYRLVKRTGLNNWYIPADRPFTLTDRAERFALWRKVFLRTPLRRMTFAMKRVVRRVS
jgi:FkbM family methyltransferase